MATIVAGHPESIPTSWSNQHKQPLASGTDRSGRDIHAMVGVAGAETSSAQVEPP
ncbi:hypothetical protein AB0H57_30060 [Micromonospora sp. NPDC050686]|uniref:hypothetical protein n=1 Tax=Micromonospora sp. NPDC050686 TaxID=3154631 RepID=UPI0033DF5B19